MQYLTFAISIAFISWVVGMTINALIKNRSFYVNLSNLNFIRSEKLNKMIGLGFFKWIVKNTFFKFFNQKLKLKNRIEIEELTVLRKEMTFAEISHLIGFGFMLVFTFLKFINGNYLFGLVILIVNILMNLYPALLQQENMRRIDRFIKRFG